MTEDNSMTTTTISQPKRYTRLNLEESEARKLIELICSNRKYWVGNYGSYIDGIKQDDWRIKRTSDEGYEYSTYPVVAIPDVHSYEEALRFAMYWFSLNKQPGGVDRTNYMKWCNDIDLPPFGVTQKTKSNGGSLALRSEDV